MDKRGFASHLVGSNNLLHSSEALYAIKISKKLSVFNPVSCQSLRITSTVSIQLRAMKYHTIACSHAIPHNLTDHRPMEQMKLDKYQIVLLLPGYPGPESLSIHCLFVFWYFLINWDNKVLFGYVHCSAFGLCCCQLDPGPESSLFYFCICVFVFALLYLCICTCSAFGLCCCQPAACESSLCESHHSLLSCSALHDTPSRIDTLYHTTQMYCISYSCAWQHHFSFCTPNSTHHYL